MPSHDMQPLRGRQQLRKPLGMTKLTYGCQQHKMYQVFHLTLNTTDICNIMYRRCKHKIKKRERRLNLKPKYYEKNTINNVCRYGIYSIHICAICRHFVNRLLWQYIIYPVSQKHCSIYKKYIEEMLPLIYENKKRNSKL